MYTIAERLWLRDYPEDEVFWAAVDAACARLASRAEIHPGLSLNEDGHAVIEVLSAPSRKVLAEEESRFKWGGPPVVSVVLFPDRRELGLSEDYMDYRSDYGDDVVACARRGSLRPVPRFGIAEDLRRLPVIERLDNIR